MPKEKAIIYARVSSKEQEESGFSIPAQIDLLQQYCKNHDFEVVKIYTENTSAKETGQRPVYDEMMKFLRKQKTKYNLVFEKNDRILRNEYDSADIINLARTTPHDIHSLREGLILNRDAHPSQFFVFTMYSANSSIYSRNLSLEVRKGMNKAAELGWFPGNLPCGYKRGDYIKGEKKKRAIEVDTLKSGYIIRAFELYSTGMYSYQTLADKLAAEGFIYKKYPVNKSNIEYILKNPFYTGNYIYNGKQYYTAQYTPIISEELFIRCKRIREGSYTQKVQDHEFLYSNMIKCSECGCSLVGEIKKGKYIYYGCRGRKCGLKRSKLLKQEIVDEFVNNLISSISIPEDNARMILSQIKKTLNSTIEYENKVDCNIENEIQKYRKRLSELYNDKLDGTISQDFYIEKRNEYQNSLDELTLKKHSNIVEVDDVMEKANICIELLKNAHDKYLGYDMQKKRYFVKLLVSNFSYDGQNLHANLKSTVKILLESACFEKWWALDYEARTFIDALKVVDIHSLREFYTVLAA